MKLDSRLLSPKSVAIYRRPVSPTPSVAEFQAAAEEALGVMRLELEGEPVVLKPNVTAGEHFHPEAGITTHPAFVGGMVRYLRAHGAAPNEIHIVEDPHNQDDESPPTWENTGYPEMARAVGTNLSAPARETIVRKSVPQPLAHTSRLVSSLAVEPGTIYINVPKLKTHNLAITTLCIKNQQGLVYVLERHYCAQAMQEMDLQGIDTSRPREEWMDEALHERWQEGLARRLADLATIAVPHLNVIEGVVGRDGTGFNRGTNYPLGLVVAGVNMVAVDSVASYLMGFDPQQLIYLRVAAEAGLGIHDPTQLDIYTSEGGELIPCDDLDRWRANPSFNIIRGVRPEASDPNRYRLSH
jgi:uncharacterized protein (DUF362 family)